MELDKALRNGETEKAEELQKDIDVLRGVLKLGTVPVVMKRAAELAGIAEIGPARKPVLECSAQDDEKSKRGCSSTISYNNTGKDDGYEGIHRTGRQRKATTVYAAASVLNHISYAADDICLRYRAFSACVLWYHRALVFCKSHVSLWLSTCQKHPGM